MMARRTTLAVIGPLGRRAVQNARWLGCTCGAHAVRWDYDEAIVVLRHKRECPRWRGDDLDESKGGGR